MKNYNIQKITIAGLLIAIGIVIPAFSPLKVVMEPASFTLGSHIAIFIAMFISPGVAVAVVIGTTLGFFIGGFPLVIVIRAASHIIFAVLGAMWLRKSPIAEMKPLKVLLFSLAIAVIHGVAEYAVVSVFYFAGGMGEAYYTSGFMMTVVLLVGAGTVVHSMVDFAIAYGILLPLKKSKVFPRKIEN